MKKVILGSNLSTSPHDNFFYIFITLLYIKNGKINKMHKSKTKLVKKKKKLFVASAEQKQI